MQELVIGPWAKSFPPAAWGMTQSEFLDTAPALSSFATPLLTLDRGAMAHNVASMAAWAAERGLELAPHGKTTMAPQLWQQVLDAGAWGITLATGWQVQIARSVGVRRIILANELLDPVALRWLGAELADPQFHFLCWVDSVAGVEAMDAGLANSARPVDVVLEVGQVGGRAGARGTDDALAVVRAVEASRHLRLAGVGGYEGSYATARTPEGVAAVERYLDSIVELHGMLDWQDRPVVTAGGSAWFDLVADKLGALRDEATVILRSGAYQVHDDGIYSGITPLAGLRAAMHGWARVLSRPEPGFALLDGGKRDFPYDEGMPVTPLGTVEKLNDQHAYLRSDRARVGQVVRLGLSHPCTAFDKWRLIPVVDNADAADPVVVDLVRTFF